MANIGDIEITVVTEDIPMPVDDELAEVWCVNDASNAVAMVNGQALCATCFVPAYAEARKAARA